jgi:hypothetical protein
MANDIMTPLLLVPDVTTVYVIDRFDSFFSSDFTFEGQKNDIRKVLANGSDEHNNRLKCPSTFISDIDDGKVWHLQFQYGEHIVNLILYHQRDFLIEWPSEIQNINHVMMMGSFSWDSFEEEDCSTLLQMLETRTTKPFKLYALWFNHKHFPHNTRVKYNRKEIEDRISMIDIDRTDYDNWILQIYPPPIDPTAISNLSIEQKTE